MNSVAMRRLVEECISEVLQEGKYSSLAMAGLLGLAALKGCNATKHGAQCADTKPTTHLQNDPSKELPSEKDMDSWDLAGKYTDRNVNLAKKLKPAVDRYFGPDSVKEMIKECVINTLREDLEDSADEIGSEQHGRYAQQASATKIDPSDYGINQEGYDPQSNAGPNPAATQGSQDNPYPAWNAEMQRMEEEEDPQTASGLSLRDELAGEISDNYKMIYGSRPRFINFQEAPIEELQAMAKRLRDELNQEFEQEKEDEKQHQVATKKATTRKPWTVGDITGLK